MLAELRVRELGVIDDVQIVFAPGLTAITGETGAGKTLVVEALELLLGGRADSTMVREGAVESTLEGAFSTTTLSWCSRVRFQRAEGRAPLSMGA